MITVVAVALAAAAAVEARIATRARAEVSELLLVTGLAERAPATVLSARREPDPFWARLLVARALIAESVDPRAFATLSPQRAGEEIARVGERLELARELAIAAAAERPAVWQAPMLEGAAVYHAWSRIGSPEMFIRPEAWRGPLEHSLSLAPGKAEPRRVLAAAFLEIWGMLGPGEQWALRPTLETAFADPETFARLAPLWLQQASSLEQAFDLVPSDLSAWSLVERLLAGRRAWQASAEARIRRRAVLEQQLEAELVELRRRVAGGDRVGARRQLMALMAATPPDVRNADLVADAWTIVPAGAVDRRHHSALRPWLDWALQGFVRGRELLPPRVVGRLATAAGELAPHERALALLAAGRLAEAEAVARRAEDLNTERWADYCVAAARELVRRGELDEARRLLELLSPVRRLQLPAASVVLDQSPGPGWTAALAAAHWPATSWRWSGQRASLDLLPEGPGELELTFDVVPRLGAVVEVSLDFEVSWIGVVEPATRVPVPLPEAGAGDARYLVVETVAGGRVMPGAVALKAGSQA